MIMEMQLNLKKKEEEDKAIKSECIVLKVRLPKLLIMRFNGTHIDWFRIWNQFESETDRSELSAVSKFSLLKEFILLKIRVIINGLPFTSEGYTRAKNILTSNYDKPNEIANTHIRSIIPFPHINTVNLFKTHEFPGKLLGSFQALETMCNLKEIHG